MLAFELLRDNFLDRFTQFLVNSLLVLLQVLYDELLPWLEFFHYSSQIFRLLQLRAYGCCNIVQIVDITVGRQLAAELPTFYLLRNM
jgi:hypothetical protein